MRILAMYLPQFHRVKENDIWWGEGYTDWIALKNAVPLFDGHLQPRIPLNSYYYNLLDKTTMERQANLINRYGIDGLCFYHYYFKNGKKILEKPAENLLKWNDINMPFCFSWANDSWVRTWSNVEIGNSWASKFEKNGKMDENKGILLEQSYGNEEQWKEHFYYLVPFFKDKRYIKIDGRPIFIIYMPEKITCLNEMKRYWNELAKKENIPLIYYIGTNSNEKSLDNMLLQEPQNTMQRFFREVYDNKYDLHMILDYDEVWKKLLAKSCDSETKICLGGFVDYDDTPRRGKDGCVIQGATPEKFKKYLIELLIKAKKMNSEFVFLNAWNEWGEGMYLEPDEKWKYAYLEAVSEAKNFVEKNEHLINQIYLNYKSDDLDLKIELQNLKKENRRYQGYWMILSDWLKLKMKNISIGEYLKKKGIKNVAIYGIGMLGKHLINELEISNINIAYGVDRKIQNKRIKMEIFHPEDNLPDVELIIITVDYDYEIIKNKLSKKISGSIVSLREIIQEVNEESY